MKSHIQALLLVLIGTCCYNANAQQEDEKLVLKARSYKDSIVLRWVPKDLESWRLMNTQGVTLVRTNTLTQKEKVLTSTPLKPYRLEVWKTRTDTTNIFVATAAQCLLGETKVTTEIANQHFSTQLLAAKEQKNTLAFAAMSADFSVQAADGLAFRWADRDVNPTETYTYHLEIDGNRISNPYVQRMENDWKPSKVVGIEAETSQNSIEISWPKTENNSKFSGYYVERSTNGKNFTRISNSIVKATSSVTYTQRQRYTDENIGIGKTYTYRVIGVTAFADFGLYSEIVSVRVTSPQNVFPVQQLKMNAKDESTVNLSWTTPEETESIKGYAVVRSRTKAGPFTPAHSGLLPVKATSYEDNTTKLGKTHFYAVVSVGKGGNTAETPSKAVILADNTSPNTPQGLIGKIDSLGVVSLAWNFGDEEDLKGYRVFRSDTKQQTFQQLTTSPVPGNYYSDTLSLKTLKKKVLYKVRAYDYNYNPSEFSEILVLERPDFIAPVPPTLTSITKQKDSIQLQWDSSAEKDVAKYHIYRKVSEETDFKKIATVSGTEHSYQEPVLKAYTSAAYRVSVMDGSGNESSPSKIMRWIYENKNTSFIPTLSGNFNAKTKDLALLWNPPAEMDGTMIIYRDSGKGLKQYASARSKEGKFIDKAFFQNSTGYEYQIKLLFSDGMESALSNTLKVNLN